MDSAPETCLMENIACEAHSNNVIEVGDSDLATCRQMCSYREGCEYLTFYGSNSFPLHDYCMLFSSCDSQHQCNYCQTEAEICFETCSHALEGNMGGENLLDVTFDVEEEISCKLYCSLNPQCTVYTHYNAEHSSFPNYCFLMTALQEPFSSCDNCKTGTPRCSNDTTPTPDPSNPCASTCAGKAAGFYAPECCATTNICL